MITRCLRLLTIGGKSQHSFSSNSYCFHYRAEYDHPCVVNKSRKIHVETMNDEYQNYDDWSKFNKDPNVQNLMSNPASAVLGKSDVEKSRIDKIRKANNTIIDLAHKNEQY